MHENDSIIDQLSQDASNLPVTGQVAPDWNIIKARLDIEMPIEKKRKRRFAFWLFTFGTILLLSSVFFFYNNKQTKKIISTQNLSEKENKIENTIANQTPLTSQTNKNEKQNANINRPSNPGSKNNERSLESYTNPNSASKQLYNSTENNITNNNNTSFDKKSTEQKFLKNNDLSNLTNTPSLSTTLNPIKNRSITTQIRSNNRNKKNAIKTMVKTNEINHKTLGNEFQINLESKEIPTQPENKEAQYNLEGKEIASEILNEATPANAENKEVLVKEDQKEISITPIDVKADKIQNKKITDSSKTNNENSKTNELTDIKKKSKKGKTTKKPNLEIALSYGGDFSMVKYKHIEPISHNYGMNVAFLLSKKWSIRSGFYYTKKNYKADGKDYEYTPWYTLPPYTSTKLIEAIGICSMQEVPLSIRYSFPLTKKAFDGFINVGLSTYFMQNEDYTYTLQYNNFPIITKQRTYLDNSNYILSIADISFGVRKQLKKHLFFEIQPFMKLPLKNIGVGNIKINSLGSYFNVVYQF